MLSAAARASADDRALFVTVLGRLALSPVLPDSADKHGTANALIGSVLTGMWLAYALTQFPSGMLADRFGDRLLITLSTGGTGVSALVVATAPTFWLFAAGAVCLGGVAGFHYSVGTAYSRASTTTPEPRSGSTTWGLRSPGWPHLSSSRGLPSDTAGDLRRSQTGRSCSEASPSPRSSTPTVPSYP